MSHTYSIFHKGKELSVNDLRILIGKKQVMLAFHGFGQHAGVYKRISGNYIGYIFFSFDLLFHGRNNHSYDEKYNVQSFLSEMHEFFDEFSIQKFHLVAFSIGARAALALSYYFPEKLQGMKLIAPDAIYENRWYHLATRTRIGKEIFKRLVENEAHFNWIVGKLVTVSKGNKLFRLAEKVLKYHSVSKIYNTWSVYSSFTFDAPELIRALTDKNIQVIVVLSIKDHVIDAKYVKKRLKTSGNTFVLVSYKHEKLLSKLTKAKYFEKDFFATPI